MGASGRCFAQENQHRELSRSQLPALPVCLRFPPSVAIAMTLSIRCFTVVVCAGLSIFSVRADADTLLLDATADTSLYEVPAGDPETANSLGEHLFAGRIASGERRRLLLRFNLGAIPAGATVTSAQLSLSLTRDPPGVLPAVNFSLFPVTADWGEGSSDAGSPGGNGIAATAGDPTWTQRAFPSSAWSTAGGDIAASASAVTSANGLARYQWGSTTAMVSVVQSWVDTPSSNFGWMLIADEAAGNLTARRFASREAADIATRPQLRIEFTPGGVGPPQLASSIPTLSWFGLFMLMALVAGFAGWKVQFGKSTQR